MAGAHARGTYGVMMRERAEMVVRVQTGEVSGVGLHTKEAGNESAVCSVQHTRSASQQHCHIYNVYLCVPNLRCHLVATGPGNAASKTSLALSSSAYSRSHCSDPPFGADRASGSYIMGELHVVHYKQQRSLGTKAKNYSEQANVIRGRQTS